jgi:hypothetical protein
MMLTKRRALNILARIIDTYPKKPQTQDDVAALQAAHADLAKCTVCVGRGQILANKAATPGYKVKLDGKGRTYYTYPCLDCQGTGRFLGGICQSCGLAYETLPSQLFQNWCPNCENRLLRQGILR